MMTLNEVRAVKNSVSQIYYWLRKNGLIDKNVSAELGAIFAVLDDKEMELRNGPRQRA